MTGNDVVILGPRGSRMKRASRCSRKAGTAELDRRGGTAFKVTFTEIRYKERQ